VTYVDEADLLFGFAKGFHHAVDAVAGQAKNSVYPPGDKTFYEYVGSIHFRISVWDASSQLALEWDKTRMTWYGVLVERADYSWQAFCI